jgi:hypothetical protein
MLSSIFHVMYRFLQINVCISSQTNYEILRPSICFIILIKAICQTKRDTLVLQVGGGDEADNLIPLNTINC